MKWEFDERMKSFFVDISGETSLDVYMRRGTAADAPDQDQIVELSFVQPGSVQSILVTYDSMKMIANFMLETIKEYKNQDGI